MAYTTKLQIALTLVGIFHLLFLWAYASATGFTTDLIHRDSPLSPFYNPSSTHYDRLHDAIQRSLKRINHFESKFEAPLRPAAASGEYLMKVSLGTPPVELLGIADTGSDLTWTQCLPCTQCYNQTLPLFDPARSSSYRTVSCDSDACNNVPHETCGDKNSTCQYYYLYMDISSTKGDLATETFTIGNSNSTLPEIVFGCGHLNNGGTFATSSSTGSIGLSGGKFSLVSQLGLSNKKFSYCLPPKANSTSKISFGSDAVVSGSGVVTTPIFTQRGLVASFYFLSLEAFTVGNRRIPFTYKDKTRTTRGDVVEGNIVIDSGTVLTLLPLDTLHDLVSALEQVISLPKVDDPNKTLELCYRIDGKFDDIKLPNITANFKGADVVLQPLNTFTLVADDIICLAVEAGLPVFGNLAQMNFLVGYDLDARTVSFKPTDCTKQQ